MVKSQPQFKTELKEVEGRVKKYEEKKDNGTINDNDKLISHEYLAEKTRLKAKIDALTTPQGKL